MNNAFSGSVGSTLGNELLSLLKSTGNVLYYSFKAAGSDDLHLINFSFEEGLSSLFKGEITLASRNAHIKPDQLLDQIATIGFYRNGTLERSFHGIIQTFTKGDTGHDYTFYKATLVPALYRLNLKSDSRIYQNKTVVDIVESIFKETGITDYALALRKPHEVREYCVQYRETCLVFIERLLAEEGVFYYFEHSEDKHTLVLGDDTSVTDLLEGAFPYNPNAGAAAYEAYIRSFGTKAEMASTEAVLKDYSFKSPSFDFLNSGAGASDSTGDYEYYDYPGRYKDQGVGKAFADTRIKYLQRDSSTMLGKGMFATMIAGFQFQLSGHSESALNQKWLLTRVIHEGTQAQSLENNAGAEGVTTYNNHFTGIPYNRQWKPMPETKPRVDGPQIAIIVGPKGEEIYCDEFGRVKVQFPWDRYGSRDEESTCWIRVAQGWAGPSYGSVTIPRIGHEVIVSFLEGDPDQPLITGRGYHATNRQPHALPTHKTKTVMKTQTHKGAGFNEFTLEDEAGQEEIYIHAQKDMNTLVKNDQVNHIEHDHHLQVDNHLFSKVDVDANYTVEGERRTEIKSNEHYKTESSLHAKQEGKWLVETGDEIHFKAGSKVVLDAGEEITVKVGNSFVKITSSTIDIVSGVVNINAGGSAGTGTALTPKAPLTPAQMSTLAGAAPFCEECESCKDGACEVPSTNKETPQKPEAEGTEITKPEANTATQTTTGSNKNILPGDLPDTPANAPMEIDFSSMNSDFNELWGQSFPDGKAQEFGGTIVRDTTTGEYSIVNTQGGTTGTFSPNLNVSEGQSVEGVFHTHPYDASEGGYTGVSLSGGDAGYMINQQHSTILTQSGSDQFMYLRTAETPASIDFTVLNDSQNVRTGELMSGGNTFSEASQKAAQEAAKENGLAYYMGNGGIFTRVDP